MATKSPPPSSSNSTNAPPPEQGFPSQLPYPFPPGAFPPFFGYPPAHPDGPSDPGNGQPGPPFMPMPMMFMPGHPYPAPPQPATPKHKRKQVKMACTNCAAACKRCDTVRPCIRCKKYGLEDSCQNGQRKERKRGTKRGPYKRKNSKHGAAQESSYGDFNQASGDPSEWPGSSPHDASSSTSPNQGHPPVMLPPGVPFPPGAPEGMHPMFFSPPPPHMYTMPPEAFAAAAAAAAAAAQAQDPNAPPNSGHHPPPPPMVPFYMGYPPFAYHPGAMFPMPPGMEAKRDENGNGNGGDHLESAAGEEDGLTMAGSSPAKTSRSNSEESEPSAGVNIPPMSPA